MSYFDHASDFRLFNAAIKAIVARIRQSKLKPQAVAARGMSGALVVMAIAAKLKIPAIIIRKEGESSHACGRHERTALGDAKTYIIVDDFVTSGRTVDAIMDGVSDCTTMMPKDCKGVFEYQDRGHRGIREKSSPENRPFKVFARVE